MCPSPENIASDEVRGFQDCVQNHIRYSLGRRTEEATEPELFRAVALAVRDLMLDRFFATEERFRRHDAKRMYFLSMEYLMGRSLATNLANLGIYDLCRTALAGMNVDLEDVIECEDDAALGNGGLGRLAACFLDSLASFDLPGFGYGIHYEYGLFKQEIDNGYQKEKPDRWPGTESPWLLERPHETCLVPIYGKIEHALDRYGNYNPMWLGWKILVGVPYDMFAAGFGGGTVNFLRLFSARASDEFDIGIFNEGDYLKAVEQKITSETLSKVLYPSDSFAEGKELRLAQEYFLVACAIRDIVRRFLEDHDDFDSFPEKVAVQLNDTHPALAVAELVRVLLDEHELPWDRAWAITEATFGYTNHTLLPEALEKWSVPLLEHVLPRHLQIIFEINHHFLERVAAVWPGDVDRLARMSVVEETAPKQLRMAHLSIVGSHSANGVAALHSQLLQKTLFKDFFELWPEKFSNKTNGVTQRRWLLNANPALSGLISEAVGDHWIMDMDALRDLEAYADDGAFQEAFLKARQRNKRALAKIIWETARIRVDPESLFDVQVKRIHEYKRQLLNLMQIIDQYLGLVEDQDEIVVPKTYVFAGKAAPGYLAAKLIIKLINCVGAVINGDKRVKDRLKVVFIPDYRVTLAERIIPAADLSEQISTAGMEASGTGNMKLAMNGALTIGTLDGANIEIAEEVGAENMFLFGLSTAEVAAQRSSGSYNPWDYYDRNPAIKRIMDSIADDRFCREEQGLFRPVYEKLLNGGDYYFHLADLEPYLEAQKAASREFERVATWARKSILTIARSGKFSSDRTIREYAREVWTIEQVSQ